VCARGRGKYGENYGKTNLIEALLWFANGCIAFCLFISWFETLIWLIIRENHTYLDVLYSGHDIYVLCHHI
jgi:hypothetical protein